MGLEKLVSEVRIKHGSVLLSCSCFAMVQQLVIAAHSVACDCREWEAKKHLVQESSPVLPRMKR